MSVADKLNYTKTNINELKKLTNETVLSNVVENIKKNYGKGTTSSSDEWKPEPDWWDIKSIIENDTEEYEQKVIFLLSDILDDRAATNTIKGFEYYKTSDGQAFSKSKTENFNISDIFDVTKDKECSKGYKTRYIIGYTNSQDVVTFELPMNTIYIIVSNIKYNVTFSNSRYLQAIVEINNAKLTKTSFKGMFSGCHSLQNIPQLNTSEGTDFSNMFSGCYSLQNIPQLNTNKGINFGSMFYNCHSLQSIPQLDTSEGTSFSSMFSGCYSLQNIPQLDISKGTNHNSMFYNCYSLQSIPQLDTSKGTNFSSMFSGCHSLQDIPLLNTSKGTGFFGMFSNCNSLQSIPQLDISKGTNFSNMFSGCYLLQNIPQLDISKGTGISDMFSNCYALTKFEIIGEIKSNLYISSSQYLQHSVLLKILNALVDNTGEEISKKLTLGSTNLAKLTDEEKAIATNKNWTLS